MNTSNLLSNEEKEALKKWLGEDGIRFFKHLKGLTGNVAPCLKLNVLRKGVPVYPVHFREGMQVRNWLRENSAIAGVIDSATLDNCYREIIEDIISDVI